MQFLSLPPTICRIPFVGIITLTGGLAAPGALASPSLPAPVGELEVSQRYVRTGVRPRLTWKIVYPTNVDDRVTIEPTGTVRTRKRVAVSVRAIGSGYKSRKSNNGHGNNIDGVDISNPGRGRGGPNGAVDTSAPIDDERKFNGKKGTSTGYAETALWVRSGAGDAWEGIYAGSAADLQPDEYYYEGKLAAGETFDVAARSRLPGRDWGEAVTTEEPSRQVIVLKNGDPVPTEVGAFSTGEISSYLTGYVGPDGRVFLGPDELIYLFDLDGTPNAPNFDLQDLGVHVLFQETD